MTPRRVNLGVLRRVETWWWVVLLFNLSLFFTLPFSVSELTDVNFIEWKRLKCFDILVVLCTSPWKTLGTFLGCVYRPRPRLQRNLSPFCVGTEVQTSETSHLLIKCSETFRGSPYCFLCTIRGQVLDPVSKKKKKISFIERTLVLPTVPDLYLQQRQRYMKNRGFDNWTLDTSDFTRYSSYCWNLELVRWSYIDLGEDIKKQ